MESPHDLSIAAAYAEVFMCNQLELMDIKEC